MWCQVKHYDSPKTLCSKNVLLFCLQICACRQKFASFAFSRRRLQWMLHAHHRGLPSESVPDTGGSVPTGSTRYFRKSSVSRYEEIVISHWYVFEGVIRSCKTKTSRFYIHRPSRLLYTISLFKKLSDLWFRWYFWLGKESIVYFYHTCFACWDTNFSKPNSVRPFSLTKRQ